MTHVDDRAEPIYSSLASDPDLLEIVEMFVDEMPDRTAAVVAEFEKSSWDDLRRLAHQIKGSAGSYGFLPISQCAATLEQAVTQGWEEAAIRDAVDNLVAMCGRASSELPPGV